MYDRLFRKILVLSCGLPGEVWNDYSQRDVELHAGQRGFIGALFHQVWGDGIAALNIRMYGRFFKW